MVHPSVGTAVVAAGHRGSWRTCVLFTLSLTNRTLRSATQVSRLNFTTQYFLAMKTGWVETQRVEWHSTERRFERRSCSLAVSFAEVRQLVICCGAGVRLSYVYWMMSILVSGINFLLLVWQAPLGVRSAKRRHQSPEWTILSHSYRLIQGEIVRPQVLLDSLHPRSSRTSWWSPPDLRRGSSYDTPGTYRCTLIDEITRQWQWMC